MRKWLAMVVMGALTQLTVAEPVLAMSVSHEQIEHVRVALTKMKPGPETQIVVKLKDGSTVTGFLDEVREHSFFVTDRHGQVVTQIAYQNVTHLKARSTGANIAIVAIAVGVGVLVLMMHMISTSD
jgi:small nuclear ribonucleoprotein (snRNP)-like protein